MYTFSQYISLEEKLIMYGQGKRYGTIVFLAGGAGSGKGFAISNFTEKEKFKIRDVDEWKKSFMKMADLQGKFPEIKGLNLKKLLIEPHSKGVTLRKKRGTYIQNNGVN